MVLEMLAQLTKDLGIFGSKIFLLAPASLGEKCDEASVALLMIIKAEIVLRELQGSANLTGV